MAARRRQIFLIGKHNKRCGAKERTEREPAPFPRCYVNGKGGLRGGSIVRGFKRAAGISEPGGLLPEEVRQIFKRVEKKYLLESEEFNQLRGIMSDYMQKHRSNYTLLI